MESQSNKVIDIIVPMYKSKGTLARLLHSIAVQTIKDKVHVILVQDADEEDYSKILQLFNDELDLEMVTLEKNSGPGAARRIGMQKGKSKYITCLDADDTFQNCFALQELYTTIDENNFDAVNSIFLEQVNETEFISHEHDWVWMFGKIYRRSFLEKNKIEMNDSRANEDTGFNMVISLFGKIGYLHDITYIWHYKNDSITRKDGGIYRFTGLEGWLYNMQWAIENLERLNLDKETIKNKVCHIMVNTFCWYNEFVIDEDKRVDINKFLEWVEKFVYDVYAKYIPTKEMVINAYKAFNDSERNAQIVPSIVLWDYMKMVGAEYEG